MLPRQLSPLLFTAARVGERARAISQALGLFLLSVNPHLHPHQTLLHMTQSLCLATCKLALASCSPLGYRGRDSLKNILLASRAANPMRCSPAGADRHCSVQVAQLYPQCLQVPFDLQSKTALGAAHSQPWPGHVPGLLQMLGWLSHLLPEATVPSSTCSSQGITESTKLLSSLGPPVKIPIPDSLRPHGHATSCLFPHFPIPFRLEQIWERKLHKGICPFSFSHSSLARIYEETVVLTNEDL